MLDWRWPIFVVFCWLATALWRRLWPPYDPPSIPTWDYPEHLTAEDREWVGKHLALTGWTPPVKSSSIAIGRSARAITSTPYKALTFDGTTEREQFEKHQQDLERLIMLSVGVPSEHIGYFVKPGSVCRADPRGYHSGNTCMSCGPLPVHDKPPSPPRVRNAMYEARCGFCERPLAAHGPGRLCTAAHVEMLTK